jgi:hypothetical protein
MLEYSHKNNFKVTVNTVTLITWFVNTNSCLYSTTRVHIFLNLLLLGL